MRGDLIFDDATVYGCISSRRLKLAGELKFAACTVIGESAIGKSAGGRAALDMSSSKINGSVIFEAAEFSVPITTSTIASHGNTAEQKSRLKRSFFCDGRKGGSSVILRGATVTDLVHLAWAHFEGELDLSFIKCRGLVSEAGFFVHRPEDTARPPNKLKQPDAVQKTVAANQQFGGARIEWARHAVGRRVWADPSGWNFCLRRDDADCRSIGPDQYKRIRFATTVTITTSVS